MHAFARFGVAVFVVCACLGAPLALLLKPTPAQLSLKESYFGTVVGTLGAHLQAEPAAKVRLVEIDAATLRQTRPWPWNQTQIARLSQSIQAHGPKTIVFDFEPAGAALANAPRNAPLDNRLGGNRLALTQALASGLRSSEMRLPLLVQQDRQIRPGAALATALTARGNQSVKLVGRAAIAGHGLGPAGIHALHAGVATHWATAPDGALRLLPAGAPTGLETVSAAAVLQNTSAARGLKDAVVLVRLSESAGAKERSWREAQGLAQLLSGLTPGAPHWAPIAEAATGAGLALLIALLIAFGPARGGMILGIAGIALLFFASLGAFVFTGLLFDPMVPGIAIFGGLVFGGLGRLLSGLASPSEAPSILSGTAVTAGGNGASRKRGGFERREVTALYCRLRELPRLTEEYREHPAAVGTITRRILGGAAEIARAHKGSIEELSPAGMLAVFNASGHEARHAERATETALAILGRIESLSEPLEKALSHTGVPFKPLLISIGIETGEAVLGGLGLKDAAETAAFGPAIDAASDLARRSGTYGPTILVGQKAHDSVTKGFALLELDLRDAETDTAEPFYALLGNPVLRASPRFKALQEGFEAFHGAYRKGDWERAEQLIRACAKLPGASSQLIALYENRLAVFKDKGPGAMWDGVTRPLTP